MAVTAHLAELERRHQAIERQIQAAQTHPSVDALEIAELKRKKLQLKDQIQKLKEDPTLH